MQVYVIENLINGKLYVGQTTTTLEKRFRRHCWKSESKKNMVITLAIAKYGKENFEIRHLCFCSSSEELSLKEIEWSERLNTMSPHGYNLKVGELHGYVSEETRRKISVAHKGKKASAEARRRMSEAHIGLPISDDLRRKRSENRKGKKLPAQAYETISKKLAKTYRLVSPEGELTTIVNLRQFCLKNGYEVTAMNSLANGKRSSYRGWTLPPGQSTGHVVDRPAAVEPSASLYEKIARVNAKTYQFISPSGELQTISNMSAFCRETGHHSVRFWELATGRRDTYRGWTRVPDQSLAIISGTQPRALQVCPAASAATSK